MYAFFSSLLSDSSSIVILMVSALAAGFLAALTPCVYPIIPITLSVIGARRYESHFQGFLVSLSYVCGMVILYAGLGIGFGYFGSLFGSVFQKPAVLIGVGVLLVFFALSMMGVLTWILPSSALAGLSRIGGAGYKGAFLMGLVSGLIAAPCTGPVLAFILTLIAQKQDLWLGVVLMTLFSMGMGVPFLVLGTFSSFLAKLPKSGPWMNVVKSGFALIMVVVGAYFVLQGLGWSSGLKSAVLSNTQSPSTLSFKVISTEENAVELLQAELEAARTNAQPVLIDFGADWCQACHELEQITFKDPQVVSLLGRFKLIKIDATLDSEALGVLQKRYKVVGLPTLIFIDFKGQEVSQRVFGFISGDKMAAILRRVP